jgi:hypothetical protein
MTSWSLPAQTQELHPSKVRDEWKASGTRLLLHVTERTRSTFDASLDSRVLPIRAAGLQPLCTEVTCLAEGNEPGAQGHLLDLSMTAMGTRREY